MKKSLDIGCGAGQPRNPLGADEVYGIDIRNTDSQYIKNADLAVDPIPFPDEFFDSVTAYDFIEHIPRVIYTPQRRNSFVELMNEIYRVLKSEGLFFSFTPAYPHTEAFKDPTHVNIITEETFPEYFGKGKNWASMYGFNGAFLVLEQKWQGPHLATLLQKAEK